MPLSFRFRLRNNLITSLLTIFSPTPEESKYCEESCVNENRRIVEIINTTKRELSTVPDKQLSSKWCHRVKCESEETKLEWLASADGDLR
jgi:hypothetical protein